MTPTHEAAVCRARSCRNGAERLLVGTVYQTPLLYTSVHGSTSAGLPREPEERLVEPFSHRIVVAVEDRSALIGAPARNHVHSRSFDLRQVRIDASHPVEVLYKALPI